MSIEANFTMNVPLSRRKSSSPNSASENDTTTFNINNTTTKNFTENDNDESFEISAGQDDEGMDQQEEATFVFGTGQESAETDQQKDPFSSAPIVMDTAPAGEDALTTTFTIDPKGNLKQQFSRVSREKQQQKPAEEVVVQQKPTTSALASPVVKKQSVERGKRLQLPGLWRQDPCRFKFFNF